MQVSSVNEVGESLLSEANTVLFSNVPNAPASLTLTSTYKPDLTALWTAPSSSNGDTVRGYKLYIDDGQGGDFSLVYDGAGFANIYTYTVGADYLSCGTTYNLLVTASNSAGESSPTRAQIRVGSPPLAPQNFKMTAVTPSVSLTLSWTPPLDNGCLPITQYTLNKDGVDLAAVISPELISYTDSIPTSPIGTVITYKLKAVNVAGSSVYTEDLVLTVGQVPNAPSNLIISS